MKKSLLLLLLYIIHIECIYPYTIKRLSTSDGLSQRSVLAIAKDDKGRMLFGTAEGLNIYDGHSVKTYKGNVQLPGRKQLWLGNYISSIKTDSQGNIFCISDANLFYLNLKENIYEQLTSHDNTQTITFHEGLLWYIEGNELKTFNPQSLQKQTIKVLVPKDYTSLIMSKQSVYIGSADGLDVYTKDLQLTSSHLKGILIYRLFESSDRELWIGTGDNGLFRYKNNRLTEVSFTPHSNEGIKGMQIRDFIEDAEGNIWIATRVGLHKYDKRKKQYILQNNLLQQDGKQNNSIFSLFIDKQNNIWVGSFHEGVCYFNPDKNNIEFYYHNPNSQQSIVYDMQMDNENNLWVTDQTLENGISCISPDWEVVKTINTTNEKAFNSNNVKSLVYDKDKNLLYAGLYMGGLAIHNLNNHQTSMCHLPHIRHQESHDNIIYHIEIWKGKVYISTPKMIYRLDERTHTFSSVTAINDKCNDFKITANGTLIARDKSCIHLIQLDNQKQRETIDIADLGYKGEISRLLLDNKGVYVLTLGSGVLYYNLDTKEIINYTQENSNLPSNYCYAAEFTKTNKIVFVNEQGITLFNPSTQSFTLTNSAIRMVPIERDNSLFVSDDNNIYVSNTKGIIKLTEEDFMPIKSSVSSLFFTQLYVNNQLVVPGQENNLLSTIMPYTNQLNLGTSQNNIRIEFAHTDYINELVHQEYAYKLDGADKSWNSTTIPSVHYSNLQPGEYVLHVRLKDRKNSPMTSIAIHVATPIYARWWAIVIYVLVSGLIIRTFYKYKTKQRELALSLKNERFEKQKIEQLNNEKLTFFTNISHEFRTPLTLINTHADSILMQVDVPITIYNTVYKLKKNAVYMNNLITELLDFRKYNQHQAVLNVSEGDYEKFVREMYVHFQELAKERDIRFNLETTSSPIMGWFDHKALEKVLINLLSNAFKYTPKGGKITLSASVDGHEMVTSVTDSGVGISAEDANQLFNRFYQGQNQQGIEHSPGTGIGLALTKSIVESHHGVIKMESEVSKGSTFTFSIPTDKGAYAGDEHIHFIEEEQMGYMIDMESIILSASSEANQKADQKTIQETDEQASTYPSSSLIQEEKEKNRTVLLVEDNVELLEVLRDLFGQQYHVLLATNGKEGLEKATTHKPDLIISDVMMPEMSGTEMCTLIKNDINLCHIPVILLTALGSLEQNMEGLNRGADDYITKPFNGQLLLARANNIIRNRLLIQSQVSKNLVEEIDLSSINPLDQEILKKAESILKENIDNPEFDVSDLVNGLNMGRSSLFAKFKALTGMTPNNYILNYRFKYAISLFHHHPELNISEVSDRCGFSSPSYFGKCFKKQYGMSPQNYKEEKVTRNEEGNNHLTMPH